MSDVIQRIQFDVKYLGVEPKQGSWREVLLLIIEIGYILMGLDLLKHTEVAVSHQHGMDPILDDTKVDDNQQVDDTNLEHNEIEFLKEGFSEK